MSKFFVLMVVMYGLLLMLSIAGIDVGAGTIISNLTPTSIGFGIFLAAIALACVTGLAVQYITKSSPDLYVAGIFVGTTCIPLLYGYYNLITYVSGVYPGTWVYYITLVVVSVLGLTYLVSAIDWLMNRGGN